ncbi:MAG: CoA-acylating methylmalonate-semialdehyde dehydrogenase [Chloroflexi bacterium]|nr:CoA-acylating methylmalonate-semialdehyde dehydrogenase [Chloroflexota bacterium]
MRGDHKGGLKIETLKNLIGGKWVESLTSDWIDVSNPANGEVIARAPSSTESDVDNAISAAESAFESWRLVPAVDRTQVLFRLKALMEEHVEDLSAAITAENGKTLDESRGEMRRTIENVEVAIGVPSLMMGSNLENVSRGIDEYAVRQPLGIFGMVPPFNFPAMVPMWFMPYAIASGNTYIIKPSEQTPLSQALIAELAVESGFPPGVLNIVHGGRAVSEALLDDPRIAGISFVGSSSVARDVYRRGTAAGKRMQCQGGAKNYLVVMPDASMDETIGNVVDSAFGAAGQRCLAGSVVLAVGEAHEAVANGVVEAAKSVRVGDGTKPGTKMGPVISAASKDRVTNYIEQGIEEGATLLLDGRNTDGGDGGYFVGPTVFDDVDPSMAIAREEIFGPVLSVMRADSLDEAIETIDRVPYGNMASIFTSSGRDAREFSSRVRAGNVGVNIGVAAPMAFFHFGGMKESFYGDLHGQARDAINFFTEEKIIVERWF